MATRIDLNLPPRLLEAARATQAANRRQLLNREQQQRDAREVKRQLRKVEEEQRKATRQRDLWKGAVPEFPLSAGVVGGRRDGVTVAHGFLTEGVVAPREYRVWSGDGSQSVKVPLPEGSSSITTNPLPPLTSASGFAYTESFSSYPYFGWKPDGFNPYNYVPPVPSQVVETRREVASFPSRLQWVLFPVGRAAAVVAASYVMVTNTLITKATRTRVASLNTWGSANYPYLYRSTPDSPTFTFGVSWQDGWSTTSAFSQEITPAPPLAYIITEKTVRAINAPQAVNQWLLGQSGDAAMTSATQGLGAKVDGVRLATPQTIEAVTIDDPQSWSPTWLQFSRSGSNPSQLVARKIRVLDPISHEPLDPTSGTLIPGLTVPLQLPNLANLPPGTNQTLLLAWDWGKPALCRQRLLDLGFSPEDLAP